MTNEILRITDGTEIVNFLNKKTGIVFKEWTPQVAEPKGGGSWKSSPLSPGRRLVARELNNVIETFELKVLHEDQDNAIRETQKLRRLLVKATQYWTTRWQDDFVWIEARGSCETNIRYALIYDYRIPQDDNPFTQPFFSQRSLIDEFTVFLERGDWTDYPPGEDECVEMYSRNSYCYPSYLEFDGDDSNVEVSDHADIQDLQDASMTVEAWIRPPVPSEAPLRFYHIISKAANDRTSGWSFSVGPLWGFTGGLTAYIDCATTDAQSSTGIVNFPIDGEWHHVAFTWNDAGAPRDITLWVDGVEVGYTIQTAGVGAIVSDVGQDLFIGNIMGGNYGFLGDIGWVRVSDNIRYAAPFTPPVRCTLPAIDGNTVGQWIYEGAPDPRSQATQTCPVDNMEGTAALDGTGSVEVRWNCDCEEIWLGNVDEDGVVDPTCADEVFVDNRGNEANITHIFVDDNGGVGPNLMNSALPYRLLPAVIVANEDLVYFGIETPLGAGPGPGGPFASIVLNLETQAPDSIPDITIDWQYWDGGAWQTCLSIYDETDGFSELGTRTITFTQTNDDWDPVVFNLVSAYWIRGRVTTVIDGNNDVYQTTRQPYVVTSAYAEIAADEIGGDIPAITRLKIRDRCSAAVTALEFNRVLVGLRSYDRGAEFNSFINISEEQNPIGIAVIPDFTESGGQFVTGSLAPTGRYYEEDYTTDPNILQRRVYIDFDNDIAPQYRGIFHAFLRVYQEGSDDFSQEVRLAYRIGENPLRYTEIRSPAAVFYQALDFGRVEFVPPVISETEEYTMEIQIHSRVITGETPANLNIIDLCLLPVDEWAGAFVQNDIQTPNLYMLEALDYVLVDSITIPKNAPRALKLDNDDIVQAIYKMNTPGVSIVQQGARQRLWFITMEETSLGRLHYWQGTVSSIQAFRQQRYLSMRGDR